MPLARTDVRPSANLTFSMWNSLTPLLWVRDVGEAQAWFRDVLDFKITYTQGSRFGAVQYGNTEIFLEKSDPPALPLVCCVRVEDADFLYALYRERGAKIVEKIESKPWRMREFTIEEPNGHRFRIGHSTRRPAVGNERLKTRR